MSSLVLINAVGLTPKLLPHAPRLSALASAGWIRPLREAIPAVTCTAQATMLTGQWPDQHGVVGNGWLFRDTGEVRFWQQSNRLIEREPLYVTAKRKSARPFKCAKLFWWFNQGADVDISVTPKPHYGVDGNKVFGILGTPDGLTEKLEQELGPFPFFTFWGPKAGLPCTQWIARCAASVLKQHHPDLTLVYLPHLDYDPQRFGPADCDMPKLVHELDDACLPLLEAAKESGARVWIVSEYGHCQVSKPVYLNRELRRAELLSVRLGPFGEQLDTFNCKALAVCDHQLAHVYVPKSEDRPRARELLVALPGVARVLEGEACSEFHLNHPRSGELVLLSQPDAWFAYPFWLDDQLAPDYARTVAIHHKPGYDPCELFVDPKLTFPMGRMAFRLAQKKLGFRMKLDVVPLDASLVRGSHGLPAAAKEDRPLLIGDGPPPPDDLPMTAVRDLVLQALE
jgi:predicted AlkP superfamily pyrophosphatase or phosphodiesterase